MTIDSVFGIHEMALQMHSKRAQVLASNLANADTPGYKAKDIDFKDAFENIQNQSAFNMQATHQQHFSDVNTQLDAQVVETKSLHSSLDKNTVDTHIEKGKMASNSIQYMASLRFIEARLKNLMTVIKGE